MIKERLSKKCNLFDIINIFYFPLLIIKIGILTIFVMKLIMSFARYCFQNLMSLIDNLLRINQDYPQFGDVYFPSFQNDEKNIFVGDLSYILVLKFSITYIFKINMKEQQEIPRFNFFQQASKQSLFEILTGNIHFPQRPFTQWDLSVDLIIRMKVPGQMYSHKSKQILLDSFLKNSDQQLASVYSMALEYITFLTEEQKNMDREYQILLRLMVSLNKTKTEKEMKYYDSQLQENAFSMNCFEQFNGEIDIFTLFYNTVMFVLQKKCGFKVRTFIAHSKNKETKQMEKVIYFLLSQTHENLLKVSTKIHMKKKIDMTDIDFHLNDPTDRKGRPLKYNSELQVLQYNKSVQQNILLKHLIDSKVKGQSRWLNQKDNNLHKQIIQEAELSKEQIDNYHRYLQEYIKKTEEMIKDRNLIQINTKEKQYIFQMNRGKLNKGCLIRLYKKKIRKRIFKMTIELNKKYGYQTHFYDDTYFEFRQPSKNKAFFEKLDHLLLYEPIIVSPSGELALFSKMERIKMAYFTLGQHFKVHSFGSFGMELFALHDDYERFGQIGLEDSSDQYANEDYERPIPLSQSWSAFVPMSTSIGKMRHYMGENYTIQAMAKINLITYFLIIAPISLITELLKNSVFSDPSDAYKFSFIELGIMVVSLTLFIQGWKIKQNKFFQNFSQQYKRKQYRDQCKGPYSRNYVSDELNQFSLATSSATFSRISKKTLGFLMLLVLITIQGIFFWKMRFVLIIMYNKFPSVSFEYLSISHVIFYGVYFIGNQLFYNSIFKKLIKFVVEWQNFTTIQQQQSKQQYYKYFFTFGVQLMGPIFLYFIQPFERVSCYAAQCIDQFHLYIYSRYFIVFFIVFFKYFKFIILLCKGEFMELTIVGITSHKYAPFQQTLQRLLSSVQQQYKKSEIYIDFRDQALAVFYYVIFTIHFPFCSIFTFALLYVSYIFERIEVFKDKRRPIPKFSGITKFSEIFSSILHLSIIFNCWAICFTFQFLQYDLKMILESFILTMTEDNIMTLKITIVAVLFIFYQLVSHILKKLVSGLDFSIIEERKIKIYKKYLWKLFERQTPSKIELRQPLRSIMRTFSHQFIEQQKKNKWRFFSSIKKKHDFESGILQQNLECRKANRQIFQQVPQSVQVMQKSSQ